MVCPHLNSVHLLGRLAGDPVRRAPPAGGEVSWWRLTVDRPHEGGGRYASDTFTCASLDPGIGAESPHWRAGDLIEVCGALRGGGTPDGLGVGGCEIEVHEAVLVAVAPARPAGRPDHLDHPGDLGGAGTADASAESGTGVGGRW